MSTNNGFPVVISAASGTGKTTLARMLLEAANDLVLSVSYTTREARGSEQDGVDYHFTDKDTFEEMIQRNAFIEWAEVHGNYYGSSREWTVQMFEEGKNVLFDIDVQGGTQIQRLFPKACLIFLVPPSMEILDGRLRKRGTDDDSVIEKRMNAARSEIAAGLSSYDYVLTNASLDRALFDLSSIVRSHRLRALDRNKIHSRLLGSEK